MGNKLTFDPKTLLLTYESNGRHYELKFNGDFVLDGQTIDVNYGRYDSPYCKAPLKPDSILFEFNGKTLHLDFYKGIRNF
jgi:hypothetical protein